VDFLAFLCCFGGFWGILLWLRTRLEFSRYQRLILRERKNPLFFWNNPRQSLMENLLKAALYERILLGLKKREEKEELLGALFSILASVFSADSWIFLLPREGAAWTCYLSSREEMKGNPNDIPLESFTLDAIVTKKKALFVEDVRFSPPYPGYGFRGSWAGIPFLGGASVGGILGISWKHRHGVTTEQLRMLEKTASLLADSMTVVLGMELLFSQAERDSLTGALNRARLQDMLASKPQKTFRGNVFFFDMDNFKEINDSFGHETGDALLQEFVSALQKRFPECPLFRYGGDEFLLLREEGPGFPEKEEILEYLRHMKESQKGNSSPRPPLEFSTGHAAIPLDASSLQEAIALADSTMYREKKERRKSLGKAASSFS